MRFWSAIFIIGTVIQTASSTSIGQLSAGRLVAGLGVGALSGIVPLYLSETSKKEVRGAMVALYQVNVVGGIWVAYVICWITQTDTYSSVSWRVPVGIQMLWGLVSYSLSSSKIVIF